MQPSDPDLVGERSKTSLGDSSGVNSDAGLTSNSPALRGTRPKGPFGRVPRKAGELLVCPASELTPLESPNEVFDLSPTRSGSEGCILTQPRAPSPAPASRGLPSPLAGE